MNRDTRIAAGVAAALGISFGTAVLIVEDWIEDEGWVLTPYQDSIGRWTVCAGHTGPDVIPGEAWTESECEGITIYDIVRHGRPVLNALVDPTDGEIRAWVGFAGNVGVGAFLSSTARKLQNAGQRVAACEQLLRWVYVTIDGRKVDCRVAGNCRGLPIRREKQMARCLSDLATTAEPVSDIPSAVLGHFEVVYRSDYPSWNGVSA